MLINVESEKGFDEVLSALKDASKELGFGVMAVHEISEILKNKGFPIDYRCAVVEVCQPRAAGEVLRKRPDISTAMPCRISVYEKDGKVVLSTVSPVYLLGLYNAPGFENLARDIEESIKEMMERASR
ncbi:MAG: DUF302 domain-containing protein [Aquificae bacterium]|nr:DUF302 domain-containing protein [Aquificota bacterium]